MTASREDRPKPPPAGVAQTAAHGGVPPLPHPLEASTTTSASSFSGLIGRFDLRDLIIVTIGFSIGFALVRALEEPGLVLALISLPAVGRVIYVKRRLDRRGEPFTWQVAAKAYAGSLIVMLVAVVAAFWFGLLAGFVAVAVMAIMALIVSMAVDLSGELAGLVVYSVAMVVGVFAAVAVLFALPRYCWRDWDRRLAEREDRDADAPPPTDEAVVDNESIVDNEVVQPVVTAEAAPRAQPPGRKQRRYDGNPRRF